MNTFFSITTILAAIFAVGAIEDCGGHCLGQENWSLFFICLTICVVSGIMTALTLKKRTTNDKSITKMRNTRRRY